MSLVFESERLVLRPLVDGDLDLLIEQWTDPDVARFVGGRIYTEQELARDMPKVTRRCAGGCIGNWCLVEKSTGGKIGTINLLPMPVDLADTDWELVDGDALPEGDIELGYILKKSAWGNGYASEACNRLLAFAFEATPLEEIVAATDERNTASQRVLEKCGFSRIGIIRNYGEWTPGFRLTREDWGKLNANC